MSSVTVNGVNGTTSHKNSKQSKNAFRRAKKKANKDSDPAPRLEAGEPDERLDVDEPVKAAPNGTTTFSQINGTHAPVKMEADDAEYDDYGAQSDDPLVSQYAEIFAKFAEADKEDPAKKEADKPEVFFDDDNDEIPEEQEEPKLSKKKRKLMNKLTVAELKSLVRRPDLVEWNDNTAADPQLFVAIKSARNVVPVPGHWSMKREYLSSKRGIEKSHFNLPKFIAETGIAEMRDAVLEKEADKSLKQKQRDRVAPKMGKLDIDYQKLYEAFFKRQTKPELTRYGEVYYEGKEYETNLRHLRPGELSDELREALGMPPGAPPPWLINMQRFGPPPSYPRLKIAGLNAPPPPGASWGFGPGQYGKPPVDEYQRPLFGGDIFGTLDEPAPPPEGAPVEKEIWGELQAREEESEVEEEADEDEDEEEGQDEGAARDHEGPEFDRSGLASSAPTELGGVESIGGEFTLRKEGRVAPGTHSELPRTDGRQAGQVIQERSIRASGFFGGERAYDLSGAERPALDAREDGGRKKRKAGDVEVSVDVDDLGGQGLSRKEMERRYEEGRREEGQWKGAVERDDGLSEMIAEEGRKRIKKDQEDRERRRQGRR